MQPSHESLHALSPFQLKDELIKSAKDRTQGKSSTQKFLNAGRGNPNWIATTPREAFVMMTQFALQESKRVWDERDFGGMPNVEGISERFASFVAHGGSSPGARLLSRAIDYGVKELGFSADEFVHELADSAIGDNYPEPDRMLVHAERVVRKYLEKEMCDGRPPPGKFDIFAVEGGTAAMCYVFKSLTENRILHPGDTIALGTPIFTPYVEMPHLRDFNFQTIEVVQSQTAPDGRHTWQYTDRELAKLEDPKVKAFFIVNPSNPASFAMSAEVHRRIVELVRTKRKDLIILTDDVYGTFAPGFRSFAADLPRNTILVYSYSKHFGCTGWRLGVVALHEDNVLDEMLARLPRAEREELQERYSTLVADPAKLKFIDRMVADSRDVALNHTAGLSLPQQLQMVLFSLFSLLDEKDSYKLRAREIIHQRWRKLLEGLAVDLPDDPLRIGYYVDLDIAVWGRARFGEDFTRFVAEHHDPLDIVLALARRFGTVLLNGSGFAGPTWSARVSLANLDTEDYFTIGRNLRAVCMAAVAAWKRATGQPMDEEEERADAMRRGGTDGSSSIQ